MPQPRPDAESDNPAEWLDTSGASRDVEADLPLFDEWSGGDDVASDTSGAAEIQHPFNPNRIDIKTRTMTVDLFLARLRRGILHLNPDFQRNAGIWPRQKQSQLIESLLLRIPLPTFYAAEVGEDEAWEVVDGVQRLTTIASFVEPGLVERGPLRLTGLQYLGLDGYTYEDLPGGLKTRLHETELVVHVIGRSTPPEVKFNVFARINTGGQPLTLQELRHALNPGPARELLAQLAERPSFIDATQGRVSDLRMSDRELVLRFLAFYRDPAENYRTADLDEFLRQTMQAINALDSAETQGLREAFDHAMLAAKRVFGDHAFRKQFHGRNRLSPINTALFEAVAVNLARRTESQIAALEKSAEQVSEGIKDLVADADFERAVSVGTGDIRKVQLRFRAIDELFQRFEGAGETGEA